MSSNKNTDVDNKIEEFVNADGSIIGGDRNVVNNSEIETGPVQKDFKDTSDYEKGIPTTTDTAARYRQKIPWFAVYSYKGTTNSGLSLAESEMPSDIKEIKKSITKDKLDGEIKEDLVKKKQEKEVFEKDADPKTEKIIDMIEDKDFTDAQLEKIKTTILNKIKNNG